jgi:hypothetical protein
MIGRRLKNVWISSRDQNWKLIREIWQNKYPPPAAKHTCLEMLLFSIPLVFRGMSPSHLLAAIFAGGGVPYLATEGYVVGSAILLSVMLAVVGTAVIPSWVWMLAIVLAAWRVVDIVTYQLGIILVDSQDSQWSLKSLHRTFVLALINVYEIVIAFAIFHLLSGSVVSTLVLGKKLTNCTEALTYSLGYMVTAGGGEFVPGNDRGRLLLILQMACQAVYVLTVLPTLIAGLSTKIREHRRS